MRVSVVVSNRDAGRHTFSVTMVTVGRPTLAVTDRANGVPTVTGLSIT